MNCFAVFSRFIVFFKTTAVTFNQKHILLNDKKKTREVIWTLLKLQMKEEKAKEPIFIVGTLAFFMSRKFRKCFYGPPLQ